MVKVCDSIMGSGKTQAAIKMMKEVNKPYIFITIYLDEADRIVRSCPERNFVCPRNFGNGKLDNLHKLLEARKNISSTHALFSGYTEETERLIREGGYTLIMDEAYSGFEQVQMNKADTEILTDSKAIRVDEANGMVKWNKEGDTVFSDLKRYCDTGVLYKHTDTFFMWEFPVEILKAFEDVYIMTFLFSGQMLRFYFDMNDIEYEYIHAKKDVDEYRFYDGYSAPCGLGLKNKIHIYDGRKINSVGDDYYSLSSSWFNRNKNSKREKQIKNNVRNIFEHIYKADSSDCLWTTIKSRAKNIAPKGQTKNFLPWNTKATNAYINRHYLAFCYNIFLNPMVKNFFNDFGKDKILDYDADDKYALSEMIQWIWRSAIRKGEDIWIYIPSSRMRNLLKNWLNEVN